MHALHDQVDLFLALEPLLFVLLLFFEAFALRSLRFLFGLALELLLDAPLVLFAAATLRFLLYGEPEAFLFLLAG